MLTESTTNLTYEKLSKEEMQQRGILGRLIGVCADFISPTRNGRKYPEQLWENIFNSDIMKERIANGVCFGELGHPADREETDMEKICICMPEAPKKGPDGKLRAVFDILDTPNGRILKSLCDYGSTLGISSRGSGDLETDFTGQESVNPDTYNCEGFDIVLLPAVKEARLQYVTESLEKKRYNKTLRQKIQESVDSESEDHKKAMLESLDTLGISLTEGMKSRKVYLSNDFNNGWVFNLSQTGKSSEDFTSLEDLKIALKYNGLPSKLAEFNKDLFDFRTGYIENNYQNWKVAAYPPIEYGDWYDDSKEAIKNSEIITEEKEKFIITKIEDGKYALASGEPPVINMRKTIEADSPEEAKEILMKYGYSEDELLLEGFGKDYSDIPLVNGINYKNKKQNMLPGISSMPEFISALEEVGEPIFKVRTSRFPLANADVKDEWMDIRKNGWTIRKDYDSSLDGFSEVYICKKLDESLTEDLEADEVEIKRDPKDTDFHRLAIAYDNSISFEDKEVASGRIADIIDYLENHVQPFDIYDNKTDNGCTIFFDGELGVLDESWSALAESLAEGVAYPNAVNGAVSSKKAVNAYKKICEKLVAKVEALEDKEFPEDIEKYIGDIFPIIWRLEDAVESDEIFANDLVKSDTILVNSKIYSLDDFKDMLDELNKIEAQAINESMLNEALSPQEKMDAWHAGTRRENIKACGDAKLYKYLEICADSGYDKEYDIIRDELRARGLWSKSGVPEKEEERDLTKLIAKMSDDKSTLYILDNAVASDFFDSLFDTWGWEEMYEPETNSLWYEIKQSDPDAAKIAGALIPVLKYQKGIKDESLNINEANVADDDDMAMVNELQEALKLNKKLDEKIVLLQEKLSACYAKEMKLEETIDSYKIKTAELSNRNKENLALRKKISKLEEDLKTSTEEAASKKTTLHETMQRDAKERKALQESISNKDNEIARLTEELKDVLKDVKVRDKMLDESNEKLETISKDNRQLKEKYSKKLEQNNKLIEKYKRIAKTAVDKYIDRQATILGVSNQEIKNRLPESYTFTDIDTICEGLREYKVNMNSLPFNTTLNENISLTAKNISNKTLIHNTDDEITDADIKLAERFIK